MRIRKIANIAEHRVDQQLKNLLIFLAKFWSSKLEKKFYQFVNFLN